MAKIYTTLNFYDKNKDGYQKYMSSKQGTQFSLDFSLEPHPVEKCITTK